MKGPSSYSLRISILRCGDCGALALSLVHDEDNTFGKRITRHKCSGRWEAASTVVVDFTAKDLRLAVAAEARRQCKLLLQRVPKIVPRVKI